MKYVCDRCGEQLPIDREVDHDAVFAFILDRHLTRECVNEFRHEIQWNASATKREGTAAWK